MTEVIQEKRYMEDIYEHIQIRMSKRHFLDMHKRHLKDVSYIIYIFIINL